MPIFDKGDKVYRWKYSIKFLNFTFSNNDTINIPVERVKSINIEERFEEYYFPLIKIDIVLDPNTYYEIIKNKNTCKINLRVDKFYFIENNKSDKSVSRKYINDIFELIMDEATDDMYNSVKEDENKSDYIKRKKDTFNDLTKLNNVFTFYLFKPVVSSTKKNVNKLLCNCNVTDAVAYLATVADINNILMAQPDNTQIYDELLLPPLSILRSLEFIDYYYGLYKEGSMIYFGLDYTYIIPYSAKCKAYYSGEKTVTNIIIPKSTNINHTNLLGSLNKKNDKTKNYIVADYTSIGIQNYSISNNYINANNLQAVDSYDAISTDGTSTAISKDSSFTKIIENKTMNPYFASIYANQSTSQSTVVSLRLYDYDISSITPNKEFNLIFEDINYIKKYNGKYLVMALSSSFIKEGDFMSLNSTLILKKME